MRTHKKPKPLTAAEWKAIFDEPEPTAEELEDIPEIDFSKVKVIGRGPEGLRKALKLMRARKRGQPHKDDARVRDTGERQAMNLSDRVVVWLCANCSLGATIGDLPDPEVWPGVEAIQRGLARLGPTLEAAFDGWPTRRGGRCDSCELQNDGPFRRFTVAP